MMHIICSVVHGGDEEMEEQKVCYHDVFPYCEWGRGHWPKTLVTMAHIMSDVQVWKRPRRLLNEFLEGVTLPFKVGPDDDYHG